MKVATKEEQYKRRKQIADSYLKKSSLKGDYYWRKAAQILGDDGDYIAGYDDGEPPTNYENL